LHFCNLNLINQNSNIMSKNKNNQKETKEQEAPEVTAEEAVEKTVAEETTEEAAEKTAEETAEEAAEEKAEETTVEPTLGIPVEEMKQRCEAVINGKGTSMKMMREVYFAIERDKQKRVNLIKMEDTPAARDIVKITAEKFLKECEKK